MANKDIVQETFPVLGMSCASCSARVEKTLNHQPGVRKAVVNYASAIRPSKLFTRNLAAGRTGCRIRLTDKAG